MLPISHGAFTASCGNVRAVSDRVRVRLVWCCMNTNTIWDRVSDPTHGDDLEARKNSVELLFFLARSHTSIWATEFWGMGLLVLLTPHSFAIGRVGCHDLWIKDA